jgi:hypothetical protein
MSGRDGASTAAPGAPVILAVTGTPLLNEALETALDGIAVLRCLPVGISDLDALIPHIGPDALVVDSDDTANKLAAVAAAYSVPLVHVSLKTRELRVLGDAGWRAFLSSETSPNAIRNVLIGEIFGSSIRRREVDERSLR